MRISDWSSDVCSSDLFAVVLELEETLAEAKRAFYVSMNALADALSFHAPPERPVGFDWPDAIRIDGVLVGGGRLGWPDEAPEDEIRSEEHTSELQSLMHISSAVFCLNKKKNTKK